MKAKVGSIGFDFTGTYTRIVPHRTIEYRISDGREVKNEFINRAGDVILKGTFEAETENPTEVESMGWQGILDNFSRYNFDDPNLPGVLQVTVTLKPVSCGTDLSVVQEGIPEVIHVEMCYLGWQESLAQLAMLVEPEILQ